MCNLVVKTLGLPPKKFLLILDSAVKSHIRSFQIIPKGTFSADSGDAEPDPLMLPSESIIHCEATNSTGDSLFGISLEGASDPLTLGQQGIGQLGDNRKNIHDPILWKIVSITSKAPNNWRSIDIQDLPAPKDNERVV